MVASQTGRRRVGVVKVLQHQFPTPTGEANQVDHLLSRLVQSHAAHSAVWQLEWRLSRSDHRCRTATVR